MPLTTDNTWSLVILVNQITWNPVAWNSHRDLTHHLDEINCVVQGRVVEEEAILAIFGFHVGAHRFNLREDQRLEGMGEKGGQLNQQITTQCKAKTLHFRWPRECIADSYEGHPPPPPPPLE